MPYAVFLSAANEQYVKAQTVRLGDSSLQTVLSFKQKDGVLIQAAETSECGLTYLAESYASWSSRLGSYFQNY
jgi:hypothetical protein